MENIEAKDNALPVAENHDSMNAKSVESSETFQNFIYELFEKNGVLSDLRAYLRGHIVNILKSAQTGDPPACQRHFTQRLELTFQAVNMLIAEYFLRLDFSYTLSVFVSEIPLANMVFDMAKTLMQNGNELTRGLRFKDTDVWSVLNYLGVKCDSEHAMNIVEMYKNDENASLLLCILKCIPMYNKEYNSYDKCKLSEESLSSSDRSCDSLSEKKTIHKSHRDKCKHYAFCKTCQSRYRKLRDSYKKKKRSLAKESDINNAPFYQTKVENLMKNIRVMEKNLIDEMFQQLKTVYETEVEMVKVEEEKKVKRALASHAIQLKKHQAEMEDAFKAREEELEQSVQQKKRFLWGVARALREQHEHMSRAMLAVRHETERLTAKEESLKSQLLEAEETLKKRGEEMRVQIADELAILEGHLESMKKERDNISRERSQLEQLKDICDSTSKIIKVHSMDTQEDLRSHYDLLKDELTILKKYLESTKLPLEAKCVIERSTMTEMEDDLCKLNVLNNEQEPERSCMRDDERSLRTPNQLVNDFKKSKNVNFSQSNLDELYRERSRERSRSSLSSEAGDTCAQSDPELPRDSLQRLRDDNQRLKEYARQQREHIAELVAQQARLQTQLVPPAPAQPPPVPPAAPLPAAVPGPVPMPVPHVYYPYTHSVYPGTSADTFGWHKGAGEELSLFTNAQPRILVPGDAVPFIGVLRDRHGDTRRHLINQWRTLRQRVSTSGGVGKLRSVSPLAARDRPQRDSPSSAGPTIKEPRRAPSPEQDNTLKMDSSPHTHNFPQAEDFVFQSTTREKSPDRPKTPLILNTSRNREKSPKSVLREAKEKLRNKDSIKDCPPTTREKSPNAVLREAKLRLRKLEIEAEAVEKSYLDFRKRQSERRENRKSYSLANEEAIVTKDVGALEIRRSQSLQKLDETYRVDPSHYQETQAIRDFDKYLREYETKFNIAEKYFNKDTVAARTKPIPEAYSKITKNTDNCQKRVNDNYLETPLTEFRKLYQCQKQSRPIRIIDNTQIVEQSKPLPNNNEELDRDENVIENKCEERKELEAIKDAIIMQKNNKQVELEILKCNITKIYNLQETITIETPEVTSLDDKNVTPNSPVVHKVEDNHDKNLLRIEVEAVNEVSNLKGSESGNQNLVLVVQSAVDATDVVQSESEAETDHVKMSANMTILISPKRSSPKAAERDAPEKARSVSPEQAAKLTRNDVLDAIFHADAMKDVSSIEMHADMTRDVAEESMSEVEKDSPEDYQDDFSADVDNYNSRSEYDNHSPVSLPKTSEDDNFWDT